MQPLNTKFRKGGKRLSLVGALKLAVVWEQISLLPADLCIATYQAALHVTLQLFTIRTHDPDVPQRIPCVTGHQLLTIGIQWGKM